MHAFTTKQRSWSIAIKSSDDNCMMEPCLLWSDHGGNSQDLVLITQKGLEFYKISPIRCGTG
jgi:hypothetical protein